VICLCGHPYLSHESGECTEKGCPCAKWEEVADSPTSLPDGFFGVQEWSGGTELGLFDFPAYAPQGGSFIEPNGRIVPNVVGGRYKGAGRERTD